MSSKINKFLINFKEIKASLWKKNKQHHNSPNRKNSINAEISTNNKLTPYSSGVSIHPIEDLLKLNYICFVFLKLIYLHYETNKVDFCIQSIRNNPVLEHLFNLSYNEFRAKFNVLQTISKDQGKNLALELSRSARFFSLLTRFLELFPPPLSVVGGVIRLGISEINKKNMVFDSKNILKFCKTYENFTKIVSLLFSCLLVKNRTDLENLDELVEKNFSIFWKILNEQAEQSLEKEKSGISVNIEKFWAHCFSLFALTLYYNSKNSLHTVTNCNSTPFFNTKPQLLPLGEASSIIPRPIVGY